MNKITEFLDTLEVFNKMKDDINYQQIVDWEELSKEKQEKIKELVSELNFNLDCS